MNFKQNKKEQIPSNAVACIFFMASYSNFLGKEKCTAENKGTHFSLI